MRYANSITEGFLKGVILLPALALAATLTVSAAQADATLSFTSYTGTAEVQSDGVIEDTDSSTVDLGMGDLIQPQPSGTGEAQTFQEVVDEVLVGSTPVCNAHARARREDVGFASGPPTVWGFSVVFESSAGRTEDCSGLPQSGESDGTFTGQLEVPPETPSITVDVTQTVFLGESGGSATGTTTFQIKDNANNLIVNQTQEGGA